MSKKKVEIIPRIRKVPCYFCNSSGYKITKTNSKQKSVICLRCGGTGYYTDKTYHLICNGICFSLDTLK